MRTILEQSAAHVSGIHRTWTDAHAPRYLVMLGEGVNRAEIAFFEQYVAQRGHAAVAV